MTKPIIERWCVASAREMADEAIVEVSVPGKQEGLLISFRWDEDSRTLVIDPYRMKGNIDIIGKRRSYGNQ